MIKEIIQQKVANEVSNQVYKSFIKEFDQHKPKINTLWLAYNELDREFLNSSVFKLANRIFLRIAQLDEEDFTKAIYSYMWSESDQYQRIQDIINDNCAELNRLILIHYNPANIPANPEIAKSYIDGAIKNILEELTNYILNG